MTDRCKRLAVGVDRLSDLPIHVLHQIQEGLSVEEAGRTSVLSSSWRYVWASNPKLEFRIAFCMRRNILETLESTISEILSQHRGAIKKFFLDVAFVVQHSVVDEWMLRLSRNGLVDLTLTNSRPLAKAPYELPSCVYEVELQDLLLSNCIFRPPSSFRGFYKLKTLVLRQACVEFYAATSSLWMPQLVIFRLAQCTGMHHLKIHAPELKRFSLFGSGTDTLKLSNFIDCGKLEEVAISYEGQVSVNSQDRMTKLTNLLSSWCNVTFLWFNCYFLKFFASGTGAVERLPVTLNRLTGLRLTTYDFDEEYQISPLLYILRSSPNLKQLVLVMRKIAICDLEVDGNYFEGSEDYRAHNLEMLKIENFRGSRIEMHFVRFIISSAPSLLKTILLTEKPVSKRTSLKISKELRRFPRASRKLKIMYKPVVKPVVRRRRRRARAI